jgi:DNA-directed RNA polymerase specialized sigma24 family protein
MICLLVKNIARSPNFYGKEYIEDAVADGTIKAMKYVKSFSFDYAESRGEKPNPYGYLTRCIQQDLVNYCNVENKRKSQHLDYIIEEGRNMMDECPYEDRTIIKTALKPLIEIRSEVKGKWSVENLKRKTS